MSGSIKKVIITFCFAVLMCFAFGSCYASSIGLSVTYSTVTVGESTKLTITGNDAIGMVNITSSNPNVVSVSSSSIWLEGSGSVTLTTKSVGTSVITVSGKLSNSVGSKEENLSNSITITSKAVYIDTRSTNNNLAGVSVTGYIVNQEFNPDVINYSVDNIPYDVSDIEVVAVAADSAATVEVRGNTGLKYGENVVDVVVTAENGSQKTYRLWVYKDKDPKDINADLQSLTISNATLRDTFSKEKTTYICDDLSVEIEKLDIKAVSEIEEAKVEITGNENLQVGTNKIIVKVTSKDESITKEYEILVYKSSEVLSLKNIEEPVQKKSLIGIIKENYLIVIAVAIIILELIIIIALLVSKNKGGSGKTPERSQRKFERYDFEREEEPDISSKYDTSSLEAQDYTMTEDVLKYSNINEVRRRRTGDKE